MITTSLTAFATTLAIKRAGATPVFADIDPHTCCLSPDSVERCITSNTKAVVVVHLYGQIADVLSLQSLCSRFNIHLIEDCAQAHAAQLNGSSVGTFGSFAA